MKQIGTYDFQFSGLKVGVHELDWEVEPTFFDAYKGSGIDQCKLILRLSVDKKERLMTLNFDITGEVIVKCDRCNEPLSIGINSTEELIARFSNETDLTDDKVLFLDSSEYKLDLTQFIYEFTVLDLPLKRAHEEGECNPEVVSMLSKDEKEEKQIDPRWEALKNIQKE